MGLRAVCSTQTMWKETVLAQELSLAEERQTVKLQELSEAVDQA